MATTKVSELSALTTTDGAEELLINDGGTSKKVTIANLLHDNSIDSDHYVNASIDNAHLADDAVGIDELSATGSAGSSTFLRGDNSWVTPTDTNTMGSGFTVSATTDTNATTITQGDDLLFTAGTGITCETTADGTVTITNTVSGASTATSSATGVIKLEDDTEQSVAAAAVSATSSRTYGLQLNSSDQGVVNVPWTDTNTTYSVQDGELSQNNFTNTDHTKLNGIEASADVTDATNVTAAGALMDSECAGLAALKLTTGTFLSADESKLDAVEAAADVTDATNVASAGAGMLTVDQSWSGSQRGTPSTVTDGTLDLDTANNFQYTPAGADVFEFTNEEAGQSGFVKLINPSAHAISVGSEVKKGASWDVSTAGTYLVSYYTDGTNVYVSASEALS